MKNRLQFRILAAVLCLSLLPVFALAEETAPKTVTRSDFELRLSLHPEGFPSSSSRLTDWQTFLDKISLQGYANIMDFLNPYSRVYVDTGLYVGEKNRVPFVYDGYHSYRYLISPALRGESVHLQMHNFFEFMLKPYYFLDMPTQYLAFFLYPEASYYIGDSYYTPIAEALAGSGNRVIPYAELHELAETLDLIVIDDPHYLRGEFYFTALLLEMGLAESALEKLGDLESLLSYLDPEQEGMQITVSGNQETYMLGETTVFEKKTQGDDVSWTLTLPDPEGYLVSASYQRTPAPEGAALLGQVSVSLDEEELFSLVLDGQGLPSGENQSGQGSLTATLDGSALEGTMTQAFDFRWDTDKAELPFHLNLEIDWLHPQTGKAALTLRYSADMKTVKESVFVEGAYQQEDFFSLNDSSLEEYKERYLPSLALAFAPVVLEMPAGVLNDLYEWGVKTELLSFFGL